MYIQIKCKPKFECQIVGGEVNKTVWKQCKDKFAALVFNENL